MNQLGLGLGLFLVLHQRIMNIFQQEAFFEISKESSKLRTYSLSKKKEIASNIIVSVKIIVDEILMTKVRLSNYKIHD